MQTETLTDSTKRRNPRGVFQKVPGKHSPWWICYWDAQGRKRREKAGTKSAAIDLYRKRKNEALQGKKLPETLRRATVTFAEIAKDALETRVQEKYGTPIGLIAGTWRRSWLGFGSEEPRKSPLKISSDGSARWQMKAASLLL
jgi:hypothetical protein